MRTTLWKTSCGVVVTSALLVLCLSNPAVLMVPVFTLGGAAMVGAIWIGLDRPLRQLRTISLRVTLAVCVLVAGVTVTVFSPWLALGLGLLAVATSPPVTAACAARHSHAQSGEETLREMEDLPDVVDVLGDLTDAEVCRSWRRSFFVLAATDPSHRAAIVTLRAALLDEMSRRHPIQTRAWLLEGGRAASGPERYFTDVDKDFG